MKIPATPSCYPFAFLAEHHGLPQADFEIERMLRACPSWPALTLKDLRATLVALGLTVEALRCTLEALAKLPLPLLLDLEDGTGLVAVTAVGDGWVTWQGPNGEVRESMSTLRLRTKGIVFTVRRPPPVAGESELRHEATTARRHTYRARIRHIPGFATPAEVASVLAVASPSRASRIVAGLVPSIRKSSSMSCDHTDPVLAALIERVAREIGTTARHCEMPQIAAYRPGDAYVPHLDTKGSIDEGNNPGRTTVLIGLIDEYEGGETVFPQVDARFRISQGDALVFPLLDEEGFPERLGEHGGSVVTMGYKAVMSLVFHEAEFRDDRGAVLKPVSWICTDTGDELTRKKATQIWETQGWLHAPATVSQSTLALNLSDADSLYLLSRLRPSWQPWLPDELPRGQVLTLAPDEPLPTNAPGVALVLNRPGRPPGPGLRMSNGPWLRTGDVIAWKLPFPAIVMAHGVRVAVLQG